MSDYMLCSPFHFLLAGTIHVELSLSRLAMSSQTRTSYSHSMHIYSILLLDYMPCLLINPRRMREGYGSRLVCVCVCVCLLPH